MGYDMETAASGTYHQKNISGMSLIRNVMYDLGALEVESQGPTAEDFSVGAAGQEALLSKESGGSVPAYKLGSNDGWLVTALECEESLGRMNAKTDGELLDVLRVHTDGSFDTDEELLGWFREWLDFLLTATKEGGFRVY